MDWGEIPKRDKVLKFLLEDAYDSAISIMSADLYRDFFKLLIKENGGSMSKANLSEEEMVQKVMRKGSIDIGGGCRAVKCPESNKPAVCALCPVDEGSDNRMICSGPTEEKKKGGLIRSEKNYYEKRLPYPDCAYMYHRPFFKGDVRDGDKDNYVEVMFWMLSKLRNHPEYDVVDVFEQVDVNSFSEFKSKYDET